MTKPEMEEFARTMLEELRIMGVDQIRLQMLMAGIAIGAVLSIRPADTPVENFLPIAQELIDNPPEFALELPKVN